ncbi:MAG: glutamate mutase L [Candidatus Eisenbacteria sp.]|nr:glutamate mutase L [Candidatus Eisenbacteria bacterium]
MGLGFRMKRILITDCGSTTTKAILIVSDDDGGRLQARGEAPTTVEAPHEDVTRGVLGAIADLESIVGWTLVEDGRIVTPRRGDVGVDLFLSTSSAGGGLQMVVAGVVQTMTAESAERAALGAGAIVMDALALNDGRSVHERIGRLRDLRPDMILLSGGIDGGTVAHVVELAETLAAADPQERLGQSTRLPLIYAGNRDARDLVRERLGGRTRFSTVANIRPTMEEENLGPAREAIQSLFEEHVMAHAPGYPTLVEWAGAPVMPTPAAVGSLMRTLAEVTRSNIVGVDIGGATTDVFSVVDGVYNRTVSANLGMSYSMANVMATVGAGNIRRWLSIEMEEGRMRDGIRNKMIRPTTIPQTLEDLRLEQAVAREALSGALGEHVRLASGLKGARLERTISDVFEQRASGEGLLDMASVDLIMGSGGVLSHAPRRSQAAAMMIDALQPKGITELAVDSVFMMPHLGILAELEPEIALDVFRRDCMVLLGACVAPVGKGRFGRTCLRVSLDGLARVEVNFGDMAVLPLGPGETCRMMVEPASGFDVGAGAGRAMTLEVRGGRVGIIIDARGRPLDLPDDPEMRRSAQRCWEESLDLFPQRQDHRAGMQEHDG